MDDQTLHGSPFVSKLADVKTGARAARDANQRQPDARLATAAAFTVRHTAVRSLFVAASSKSAKK